jgi:hypothetical protein
LRASPTRFGWRCGCCASWRRQEKHKERGAHKQQSRQRWRKPAALPFPIRANFECSSEGHHRGCRTGVATAGAAHFVPRTAKTGDAPVRLENKHIPIQTGRSLTFVMFVCAQKGPQARCAAPRPDVHRARLPYPCLFEQRREARSHIGEEFKPQPFKYGWVPATNTVATEVEVLGLKSLV